MDDAVEWMARLETDDRVVEVTSVGKTLISTMFTGISTGLDDSGRPLVFETVIQKGPLHGTTRRYPTFGRAQAGHMRLVDEVIEAYRASGSSESPASS
jgi:hypothetical protein